jgi:hypothetical protein
MLPELIFPSKDTGRPIIVLSEDEVKTNILK